MEVLFETYFSQHAEEILSEKRLTKADFAKRVDVAPQNIKKLFSTNNIQLLFKVSEVLDVPLNYLINGEEKKTVIDGFVEIGSKTYRIKTKEDISLLMELVAPEPK